MDLDSLEAMNEIHQSTYRTAVKLQTLQRLCHMDAVFVRHVAVALRSVGGAMSQEEVTGVLSRMFHSASQEVAGHVTPPEETTKLMFTMFDRACSGHVAARSLHTALIALCADSPEVKFTGLLSVSDNGSGSVSRSGLRSLLQDLSQIPAAVQEERTFGGVEAAVKSCFNGVLTPAVSQQHVLSWLQSEPRLLLWLSTMYRLCISHNVMHNVRCHTCKTAPITGLRFRCLKCLNVHVCQSCFLSLRQTGKHKSRHPVLEFCSQPTWKESLSSLVHNTRHALLPRRYTQRETVRKRMLVWAEPEDSAPPLLDAPAGLADSVPASSPEEHDDSALPSPQKTDDSSDQAAALLSDVRNLQRDKRLLESELQEWRVIVQSEQGDLEYRCSEMEVTMEALRQHNAHLEDMLTKALNNGRQVNDFDSGHGNDVERNQVNDTDRGHVSELDRAQNSDTDNGHVEDIDRRQDVDTNRGQANDEATREVIDADRGHVNDTGRAELNDQDRQELGETERGQVSYIDRKHEDNTDSGQVKDTDRGQDVDMETGHVSDTVTEHERYTDGGEITPPSDMQRNTEEEDEEEEELMKTMGEWSDEELETPSPTSHRHLPESHDCDCEEEESEDECLNQQMRSQNGLEEAGLAEEYCLSEGEDDEEDKTRRPEDLLQETVNQLKTAMETDMWTQTGVMKRAELVRAAEQVGDSLLHLVDSVK